MKKINLLFLLTISCLPIFAYEGHDVIVNTGSFTEDSEEEHNIPALKMKAIEEGWTFEVGYTPAMDIPIKQRTGLEVPKNWTNDIEFEPMFLTQQLPEKWDWREKTGGLTPVKNQGSCGSCWAFGTTAVFQDNLKIFKGKSVNLSDQETLSCSGKGSCFGGYFAHSYHQAKGSTHTSDYPYRPKYFFNGCKKNTPRRESAIKRWGYVGDGNQPPSVEQIKSAIYQYGAVGVTVNANGMSGYKSGVFNRCSSGSTNHLVTLVGWDDSKEAWIMKNSWGAGWGENGFGYVKYGCNRIGEQTSFIELQ